MSPSARHLYPASLRHNAAVPAPTADGEPSRQLDGAWRVWERLRAFDRRYATWVDLFIALSLFVVCSGWLGHLEVHAFYAGDLWFVAGLTLPLIFRRRAPMTVFLVMAAVALVQWFVTGPLLADCALLVALYTVAANARPLRKTKDFTTLPPGVQRTVAMTTPTSMISAAANTSSHSHSAATV